MYWDATTDTAWTSYQVGTQWHETFFDDPTSLALKAQLANSCHIAGVGIWALGMDGNDPAMLAALLGNAPPVKDYQAGPTTTSSSSTTTTVGGPPGQWVHFDRHLERSPVSSDPCERSRTTGDKAEVGDA